jgi:hypothetical protein
VRRLDLYAFGCGEGVVGDVTGVQDACRFEAKDFGFFVGAGAMFGAAGYDEAFAGVEGDDVVSEFDAELTSPDEEELVFVLVMVPGEFAPDFDELDLLII